LAHQKQIQDIYLFIVESYLDNIQQKQLQLLLLLLLLLVLYS